MPSTDHSPDSEERKAKLQLQRAALNAAAGAWKLEDHPELANGSYEWIRYIRSLDHERIEQLIARHLGLPDEEPTP